jgi:hypothetical protein
MWGIKAFVNIKQGVLLLLDHHTQLRVYNELEEMWKEAVVA